MHSRSRAQLNRILNQHAKWNILKSNFSDFTHIKEGMPIMVDVSNKIITSRMAHARAEIKLPKAIYDKLCQGSDRKEEIYGAKGPVFATSIVAGVMGTKKTSDWIPFCHPIMIDSCDVKIDLKDNEMIEINCIVKTSGKTGVEMEALVGATNAALCVYDMLKAMSHDIVIQRVQLIKKTGGKSDFSNQS